MVNGVENGDVDAAAVAGGVSVIRRGVEVFRYRGRLGRKRTS